MKNYVYGIQPILILVYAADEYTFSICKHFDPSVDAGSRYYREYLYERNNVSCPDGIRRVYDLNETNLDDFDYKLPRVNNSCIGEFPGKKLDQCDFNGYLEFTELCNPCEKKEFKEQCDELCKTTTGSPFGAYYLK